MKPESGIIDGVPWTYHDEKTLFDLKPVNQRRVRKWIELNIHHSSDGETYNSYLLKHHMESDIGLYVTNNQFKHAMLLCGFEPLDETELNWEYYVDSDKSPLKVWREEERQKRIEAEKRFEEQRLTIFLRNILQDSIDPKRNIAKPSIIINDGDGRMIDPQPQIESINIIPLPYARHIAEIMIEDTGIIYFDANQDAYRSVLEYCDQRYLPSLLGRIGEAIIVHRCKDSPKMNQIWLSLASCTPYSEEDAERYVAIGTGFNVTKKSNQHLFDPHNTQTDVIWADQYGQRLLKSAFHDSVGRYVGLQVKASTDGKRYILGDLIAGRYEVPIAYYPLNNDYEELLELAPNVRRGIDFINVREIDIDAFREMLFYWSLLQNLHEKRITPKQVIREATTLPILKNGICATSLQIATIPSIVM